MTTSTDAVPMQFLDIVFDGPPSHESGRFVEVENLLGESVNAGEWIDRGNGLWALRIGLRAPASEVQADHIADELREASRQFHNLTQGDPTVIIRPSSAEKRDAIVAAGERLRAALAASSTGNQEVGS